MEANQIIKNKYQKQHQQSSKQFTSRKGRSGLWRRNDIHHFGMKYTLKGKMYNTLFLVLQSEPNPAAINWATVGEQFSHSRSMRLLDRILAKSDCILHCPDTIKPVSGRPERASRGHTSTLTPNIRHCCKNTWPKHNNLWIVLLALVRLPRQVYQHLVKALGGIIDIAFLWLQC